MPPIDKELESLLNEMEEVLSVDTWNKRVRAIEDWEHKSPDEIAHALVDPIRMKFHAILKHLNMPIEEE